MKSIIISDEVHEKIKSYCKSKNLKLGGFFDKLLLEFLEKNQ